MTNNTMLTAETITTAQIRTLRNEAVAAGDYAQVDICDRALATDDSTTDQDGNEVARADLSREDARAECADVINAGQDAAPAYLFCADLSPNRATVVEVLPSRRHAWGKAKAIAGRSDVAVVECSGPAPAVGERIWIGAQAKTCRVVTASNLSFGDE